MVGLVGVCGSELVERQGLEAADQGVQIELFAILVDAEDVDAVAGEVDPLGVAVDGPAQRDAIAVGAMYGKNVDVQVDRAERILDLHRSGGRSGRGGVGWGLCGRIV